MLFVRSETHLPATGHRTPYRSSTDTAPRTPLLGTLVRVRRTRVGHGLGANARPWEAAAIHENTGP